MDATAVWLIMVKEMREARQNRWFLLFTVVFAGLALGLSLLGLSGLGNVGIAGFGRTSASLLNLVMLIVPLIGLLMGGVSVASEREQGTLLTLLAQPLVAEEVLLGKYLGLAAALLGTLLAGFGATALVIAGYGGLEQISDYLRLAAQTIMFGLLYLSVGFCISTACRKAATAVGVALFVWLVSAFFSDLGLIGTAVALRLSPRSLLWLSLGNPTQVFKVLAVDSFQGNLEILGPGGLYATEVLGDWLQPVFLGLLLLWTVVPLLLAFFISRIRGLA